MSNEETSEKKRLRCNITYYVDDKIQVANTDITDYMLSRKEVILPENFHDKEFNKSTWLKQRLLLAQELENEFLHERVSIVRVLLGLNESFKALMNIDVENFEWKPNKIGETIEKIQDIVIDKFEDMCPEDSADYQMFLKWIGKGE